MSKKPILVIGAGPTGLEAARGIADLGYQALLVEQRDALGGTPISESYAGITPDQRDASQAIGSVVDAVQSSPNIQVRTGTVVTAVSGEAPNLVVTLKSASGESQVEVGAAVVATGFQHFDPGRETQMYGYYEFDDVITLVDAEKMLKAHEVLRPSNGQPPKQVCFIQCVGSRDRQIGNQWCSKVCCGIACQEAIEIKRQLPDCKVFVFYIDMRTYGFWEDQLYWRAQEEYKVNFIRGIVTEVTKRGDQVVIKGEDTTMGRPMEVPMDMVILSVGMEPSEGTKSMAKVFSLPLEEHGWIATLYKPLDTVTTKRAGVFAAGAATGPADLEDSVSAGMAAAMKSVAFVRRHGVEAA
jgi:heterodisulfide reductase subunit A